MKHVILNRWTSIGFLKAERLLENLLDKEGS